MTNETDKKPRRLDPLKVVHAATLDDYKKYLHGASLSYDPESVASVLAHILKLKQQI